METSSDESLSATPPKKVKRVHYDQKFSVSWLKEKNFKAWLDKSKLGDGYFFCKACRCNLKCSGGRSFLVKHCDSDKHLANVKGLSHQPSITSLISTSSKSLDHQVKCGEIQMALFLSKHNLSFNIAGDLKELVSAICPDSTIAKEFTFQRTKSHAIITNVTGAAAEIELIECLKSQKFSLIADESTDISAIKHLALIARTAVDYKVSDNFMCLIPISDGSATSLYEACCGYFLKNNIPFKENMIGFASDGANVMFGVQHSLSQLFKKDIPDLFLIKCICHSFHLCASYACKKLPSDVENFARDVYNYFKHSPKRIGAYAEFQAYVEVKPHKLLHPCQTRWLSLLPVVSRLLEQLPALKLFFQGAVLSDKVLRADKILERCLDPTIELYLNFLMFVLPYFNNMNKEMQSEKPKFYIIYERVFEMYTTILECFIKPELLELTQAGRCDEKLEENIIALDHEDPQNHLPLSELYCGGNVSFLLENKDFQSKIDMDVVRSFKRKCLEFYMESISQIKKRFPFDDMERKKLRSVSFLNPENLIGSKTRSISSIAHVAGFFPGLCDPNINELDREWRLLRNTRLIYSDGQGIGVEEFWHNVAQLRNGDETQRFPLLSQFVWRLLALPHSSANVERIFSKINLMKTAGRNRLCTKTINGLLHTQRFIDSGKDVTKDQLSLFNKNMYA